MTHGHTRETLIAFESRVAAAFERKEIRGPIHLCSDGQAEPLIDVFKDVQPQDWIFCTWRNHFHCLLKGVPDGELFAAICAGRSMFFCSKRHNVVSSAIVGGILPIALGVAMGIQRQEVEGWDNHDQTYRGQVWVFVGDMAARTGLFHEFKQYVLGHNLSVQIVVEDNGLSTNAVTEKTWGQIHSLRPTITYTYARNRPHTGTGKNVIFG